MSSLSNILNLFSNESLKVQNKLNVNSKEILLNNKQLAREMLYLANLKSSKALYLSSLEDLKEINLYQNIYTQRKIDRNRKINSLKAMKSAGASMEQLAHVAELYALEGFKEFMAKTVQIVKEFFKKMAAWFMKIIAWFKKLVTGALFKEKANKAKQNIAKLDDKAIENRMDLATKKVKIMKGLTFDEMVKEIEDSSTAEVKLNVDSLGIIDKAIRGVLMQFETAGQEVDVSKLENEHFQELDRLIAANLGKRQEYVDTLKETNNLTNYEIEEVFIGDFFAKPSDVRAVFEKNCGTILFREINNLETFKSTGSQIEGKLNKIDSALAKAKDEESKTKLQLMEKLYSKIYNYGQSLMHVSKAKMQRLQIFKGIYEVLITLYSQEERVQLANHQ